MSAIRPFAAADIPQVADLHRRVFGTAAAEAPGWPEVYRAYLSEVFLRTPADDGAPASLVAEDSAGRIAGFLGVVPRRMAFEGRPVIMAVCSQFVVDPRSRGTVGLRLVRQCLSGPQDLSMTDEALSPTERIWQWCGGATALLHSIRWIRPLRPAAAALAVLKRRRRLGWSGRPAEAAAHLVDGMAGRLGVKLAGTLPPRGSREPLDEPHVPAWLPGLVGERRLRPDYDDRSLRWTLARAGRLRGHGELRRTLVRDEHGRVIGWYVYYAGRGAVGEVLQVASGAHGAGTVLDHLLHEAAGLDVAALTGRLDPPLIREMSERRFLMYRRGFSTLVHSRRPDLLQAILRGDAFLSRLEGEWCLHFQ